MRSRPWPLVVLAILQILSPIGTLLLNSWGLGIQPSYVLHWLLNRPPIEIFEALLLMPIAGIAVYQMKAWSYGVFLAALAWSLYANLRHWNLAQDTFPAAKMFAIYGLQILLAGYFFLPSVRRTYLDRSVRWWEAKRRFTLDLPVKVLMGSRSSEAVFRNISEGGAMVQSAESLQTGTPLELSFRILAIDFKIPGIVRYGREQGGSAKLYGVQFSHTEETRTRFKKLVHGLELIGLTDRDQAFKKRGYASLREWLVSVFTTGKGIVPDISSERKN